MNWPYKYFTPQEMLCHCGKCETRMNHGTMLKLELIRGTYLNKPMKPSCGARCPEHNESEGGVDTSAHLSYPNGDEFIEAYASDILVPNDNYRFNLVQAGIAVGMTGIGIYRSFVHLDDHPRRANRPVIWWGKY